jgi:hypothetical protein
LTDRVVWGPRLKGLVTVQGNEPDYLEDCAGHLETSRKRGGSGISRLTARICTCIQYSMEWPRLTTKQAEALRDRIRPMLHFFYRCRRRLDARGFDQKSAIYQAIDKAYCAMHELHMTLHYESCGRGVGRTSEERLGRPGSTDKVPDPPNHPGAQCRLPSSRSVTDGKGTRSSPFTSS